ncbi:MAG: ATP synthase F0 subunit C [Phycisphaeraceae bacterium]|nr:ATP synthase F0 subunit C [Phycisphaeraceae bacterium]
MADNGGEAAAPAGFSLIPDGNAGIALAAGIGAGLIIMGGARGIGNIGSSAVESIARQPEAGGRIFTSMVLSAAFVEGATLFGVVVMMLLTFNMT